MTKPIFLVGFPKGSNVSDIEIAEKVLNKSIEQYYPIVYISKSEDYVFQCFYEKDFNEVKFEELKQIIRDAVSHGTNDELK